MKQLAQVLNFQSLYLSNLMLYPTFAFCQVWFGFGQIDKA